MKIKTGFYVGDGTDDRLINVGWKPDCVILKCIRGFPNGEAHIRTLTMIDDQSKTIGSAGATAGVIQSFVSLTGFVVGSDPNANESGKDCHWLAIQRTEANDFRCWSYEGDGVDNRNMVMYTDAFNPDTFQPDCVIIAGGELVTQFIRWKTALMPADRASSIMQGSSETNVIQAINPDGFQLGTHVAVNQVNRCYHVVALKITPGLFNIVAWVGDGIDNRSIGVGLQPTFAFNSVRSLFGSNAFRSQFHTGNNGSSFAGLGNVTDRIKQFQASAVLLGTDGSVNASGSEYDMAVFKDGES